MTAMFHYIHRLMELLDRPILRVDAAARQLAMHVEYEEGQPARGQAMSVERHRSRRIFTGLLMPPSHTWLYLDDANRRHVMSERPREPFARSSIRGS